MIDQFLVTAFLYALGAIVFALGVILTVACAACSDLIKQEAATRLERLPLWLLHRAARDLPDDIRGQILNEQWIPDLLYITRGSEGLPLTKTFQGTRFAISLMGSPAVAIGRILKPSPSPASVETVLLPVTQADAPLRQATRVQVLMELMRRLQEEQNRLGISCSPVDGTKVYVISNYRRRCDGGSTLYMPRSVMIPVSLDNDAAANIKALLADLPYGSVIDDILADLVAESAGVTKWALAETDPESGQTAMTYDVPAPSSPLIGEFMHDLALPVPVHKLMSTTRAARLRRSDSCPWLDGQNGSVDS